MAMIIFQIGDNRTTNVNHSIPIAIATIKNHAMIVTIIIVK